MQNMRVKVKGNSLIQQVQTKSLIKTKTFFFLALKIQLATNTDTHTHKTKQKTWHDEVEGHGTELAMAKSVKSGHSCQ